MQKLDVCLSPALFQYYNTENKIIVVIDVIRSTSCICVALAYGAEKIIPVETETEALKLKEQGCLISGEHKGIKLEGYDFGNSPFDFMTPNIKGKTIAMTSTNGTRAIHVTKNSRQLLTGAFINTECISEWLIKSDSDVLFLCSGWFFKVNIEDTLLAGKICDRLIGSGKYYTNSDAVNIAISLYNSAKGNIFNYVMDQSPRLSSKRSFFEKDLQYCLSDIQYKVIPVMKQDVLVPLF